MPQLQNRHFAIAVTALFCGLTNGNPAGAADAKPLDLTKAKIVVHKGAQAKAGELLADEIAKRTGINLLAQKNAKNFAGNPVIVINTVDADRRIKLPGSLKAPRRPDAYAIWVEKRDRNTMVMLLGYDRRATLFAAGHLLRLLSMTPGKLELPSDTRLSTAPDVAIRGHQIGYRDRANSYDAWDLKQFEQYIRDQIVFGVNAIELIPPVDPSTPRGPHMPLSPWEMNSKLSTLIGSYGLDVWLWVPVDIDVTDPKAAAAELRRWRKLFESCSHISDVFVPGGDPGETPPNKLLPWMAQMAALLHETHPDAGVWLSNQGFTPEENEFLFGYLRTTEPDWLRGIAFGPWAKHSIAEARARTPRKYRIRRYPDICHTVRCQYPVPEWDQAFAHTLGREPFNPRPRAMAHIHNSLAGFADGFVTYSDGIPDDVNKAIWSAAGWDTKLNVNEALTDYGRYFIDHKQGAAVARGLLALEDNWRGPLSDNKTIENTLAHWQTIEQLLPEAAKTNWRLQLALLRAYYDAYLQRRLLRQIQFEQEAKAQLRDAGKIGVKAAIHNARQLLAQADTDPTAQELRKRLVELGKLLYKSVGLQLDTPNYQASNPERGAVLDFLDAPLNDRPWLEAQFAEILKLDDQQEQQRRIQTIVNWEDPGPGGYYDNLGHVGRQSHLLPVLREKTWKADPGYVGSPQSEFSSGFHKSPLQFSNRKLSWLNQAETLFGKPLRMRYTHLDPQAKYRLRVTYAGRFRATMRLLADQTHEIHGPLPQPSKTWPVEFDIPQAATADGILELQWELRAQRGCQVAEVWLIKQ